VIRSLDPYSGTQFFECSAGDPDVAVGRAAAAFPAWSAEPAEQRAAVLRRFADLVERDSDRLAELCVREVGKVRREADGEIAWTALSSRWYADNPPAEETAAGAQVRRRPLGVLAAITPWNVPLVTPAWKWLPALMAGNTVVWKPSEFSTGIAVEVAELWREAGLPIGVLELVPGTGDVGRALCADPRVAAVHFTGSTRTGRAIAATVAARLGRCALELGGLNYVIVLADADLEHAADCIVEAAVSINGQKCTATRRVLVEEPVASELEGLVGERLERLVPGDPSDPATTIGPLIRAEAARRASETVERAVSDGARLVARSPMNAGSGAFFPATLLADVAVGDELRREELFAPVITLGGCSDLEAALRELEGTSYGLTCAIHTADRGSAAVAADRVQTGIFGINRRCDAVDLEAPFGGRRDSGLGPPEGGAYVYAGVAALQAVYGL
jgi:alpha-ketoglutaric semialdehyde dehydrogenase